MEKGNKYHEFGQEWCLSSYSGQGISVSGLVLKAKKLLPCSTAGGGQGTLRKW